MNKQQGRRSKLFVFFMECGAEKFSDKFYSGLDLINYARTKGIPITNNPWNVFTSLYRSGHLEKRKTIKNNRALSEYRFFNEEPKKTTLEVQNIKTVNNVIVEGKPKGLGIEYLLNKVAQIEKEVLDFLYDIESELEPIQEELTRLKEVEKKYTKLVASLNNLISGGKEQ